MPYRRGQPAEMLKNATAFAARAIAAGTGTVMPGRDQCTTFTALKAHAAHCNTRKHASLDHGTFVHHAMEDGLIDPE